MKRKGILEFVKKCLHNELIENNAELLEIMRRLRRDLYTYCIFSDLEKRANDQKKFFLLYFNENNLTFEDIAELTFVGIDNLKEFVKKCNQTALDYVAKEGERNPIYALLLEKYLKN